MKKLEMNLTARSLGIMQAIKAYGGFTCTGSCKQIKKGQLHCRNLGNMLDIGPTVVWDVINELHKQGLLVRSESEGPITLKLTARGEEILTQNQGQELHQR